MVPQGQLSYFSTRAEIKIESVHSSDFSGFGEREGGRGLSYEQIKFETKKT